MCERKCECESECECESVCERECGSECECEYAYRPVPVQMSVLVRSCKYHVHVVMRSVVSIRPRTYPLTSSLTQSLAYPLSLSLSHTHTHTLSLTHKHTHVRTHTRIHFVSHKQVHTHRLGSFDQALKLITESKGNLFALNAEGITPLEVVCVCVCACVRLYL